MERVKATYAKKLMNKNEDSKYSNHPSYILLEENTYGKVYGFTYTIPSSGKPEHIEICEGEEWDKCHYRLGNDKKCEHSKWHSPLCAHNSNLTNVCNCSWQNCK